MYSMPRRFARGGTTRHPVAVCAVLAVGYVAISMIVSPDDDEVSASPAETKVDKQDRPEDEGIDRVDVAAEA